jgi:hypothetical protein
MERHSYFAALGTCARETQILEQLQQPEHVHDHVNVHVDVHVIVDVVVTGPFITFEATNGVLSRIVRPASTV